MKHSIQLKVIVNENISKIWDMWTSKKGLQSFFCPKMNFQLHHGGPFEAFFDPTAPEEEKGSEGMEILSFEKEKMFCFTWNSPPSLREIKKQRTFVSIFFEYVNNKKTQVKLFNHGYGFSEDWQKAREYFVQEWGTVILPRLKYVTEGNVIDWNNRSDLSEYFKDVQEF